jgi:hypothetical protein
VQCRVYSIRLDGIIFTSQKELPIRCMVCDGDLEEGEYIYKGKSYCEDCNSAVKKGFTPSTESKYGFGRSIAINLCSFSYFSTSIQAGSSDNIRLT